MIFQGYIISIIYGFLCILLAVIAGKCGLSAPYTRKITHILVGFEWVILYHFFGVSVHFLIVSLIFTLAVTSIYFLKLVPQISSTEENSHGTVYYCIAMAFMSLVIIFIPTMVLPFGIGVFATSLGDGFGGIFGKIKRHNLVLYGNKTLFGSLAVFVFTFVGSLIFSLIYKVNIKIFPLLVLAIFASEVELISKKGLDNIFVTLSVSFLAFLYIEYPEIAEKHLLICLLLIPLLITVENKKAMTKWGSAFAAALAILSSIAFGNIGFAVLLIFFAGSRIADKIKKKKTQESIETRTAFQVLANGLIGAIICVIFIIFQGRIWLVAFCASFVEALSDTVASGFGSLSKSAYDPFRRKKVDQGLSGGMSLIGTLSALLSSLVLAFLAELLSAFSVQNLTAPVSLQSIFSAFSIKEFLIISVSAFLGCIFDSLLGSLIQVKYKCQACGTLTESLTHCSAPTEHHSGITFVDNNLVNFLSTVFSAILSALIFALLS